MVLAGHLPSPGALSHRHWRRPADCTPGKETAGQPCAPNEPHLLSGCRNGYIRRGPPASPAWLLELTPGLALRADQPFRRRS